MGTSPTELVVDEADENTFVDGVGNIDEVELLSEL